MTQKPIADVRRCFREHSENRRTHAHGKRETSCTQPHRQPLSRTRRVMEINAWANLRALSSIVGHDKASIHRRSSQDGYLKKTGKDVLQLSSDHFVTLSSFD